MGTRGLLVPTSGALIAAMALSAGTARAQEIDRDEETIVGWYGWQTLVFDAAAAGLVTVGLVEDQPAIGWVGGGVYALDGFAVHLLHGKPKRSLYSVTARVANALFFAAIAGEAGGCSARDGGLDAPDCNMNWVWGGLFFGMGLGVAFDAAVQSYETVPVTPAVTTTGTGTPLVGVAGRF